MWLLIYKLTRPTLPMASGLAAWIIARLCGADKTSAFTAATAIALSTLGASLYHFGAANWMNARKSDRLKLEKPELVTLTGLAVFCFSICVALFYLPKICVVICLFNTWAMAAYAVKLSESWITKNLTMSIVCTTPIVIGWMSGSSTHSVVGWAIAIAALAHLAREMVKDVKDIIANEGKRITLPMVLGKEPVLQLAGAILLVASILPIPILVAFDANPLQSSALIFAGATLAITGLSLIYTKKPWRWELVIHSSICLMLLAFV